MQFNFNQVLEKANALIYKRNLLQFIDSIIAYVVRLVNPTPLLKIDITALSA